MLADPRGQAALLDHLRAVAALVLACTARPEPRQATNVPVVVALLATGGLSSGTTCAPLVRGRPACTGYQSSGSLILLAFAASAYRVDAFSLAFWDCSRFLVAVVGLLGLGISYLEWRPSCRTSGMGSSGRSL